MDLWNGLFDAVISANTVRAFEARLDKLWKDQPLRFEYREDIKALTGIDRKHNNEESEQVQQANEGLQP